MWGTIIAALLGSSALSAVVAAVIGRLQMNNTVRDALKSVLYFQIRDCCIQCIKDGCIDGDTYQMLMNSWQTYHDRLGGNGYLTALINRVEKLKLDVGDEKSET